MHKVVCLLFLRSGEVASTDPEFLPVPGAGAQNTDTRPGATESIRPNLISLHGLGERITFFSNEQFSFFI